MKVTAYHCDSTACSISRNPGVDSCLCNCPNCKELTNDSRLSAPWRIFRFDRIAKAIGWWNPTGHSRNTTKDIQYEWGLREDAKAITLDYAGKDFARIVMAKYPCSRLIQDCNPRRHCYTDRCSWTRGIYSKFVGEKEVRVNLCECPCDDCDVIGVALGMRAPSPNGIYRKYPDKAGLALIASTFIRE